MDWGSGLDSMITVLLQNSSLMLVLINSREHVRSRALSIVYRGLSKDNVEQDRTPKKSWDRVFLVRISAPTFSFPLT